MNLVETQRLMAQIETYYELMAQYIDASEPNISQALVCARLIRNKSLELVHELIIQNAGEL